MRRSKPSNDRAGITRTYHRVPSKQDVASRDIREKHPGGETHRLQVGVFAEKAGIEVNFLNPVYGPKTAAQNSDSVLISQESYRYSAKICVDSRFTAKSAKIEETLVECLRKLRRGPDGMGRCHSHTFRSTRQTGTSIRSDAAPLHWLRFTRYAPTNTCRQAQTQET